MIPDTMVVINKWTLSALDHVPSNVHQVRKKPRRTVKAKVFPAVTVSPGFNQNQGKIRVGGAGEWIKQNAPQTFRQQYLRKKTLVKLLVDYRKNILMWIYS